MLRERKNFKKTAYGVLLVSMLVIGAMVTTVLTNIQNEPEVDNVLEWLKAPMALGTNNTVVDGSAGIVDIYIMNSAFSSWNDPIDHNDANIYEETNGSFVDDEVGVPHPNLNGTTPFETNFSIVVVYQFTPAMAKDGGTWNASRVRAYMNTTGMLLGNASSVVMQEGTWYDGAGANSQRINFYLTDTDGAGGGTTSFQVAIDSTFTADCKVDYLG